MAWFGYKKQNRGGAAMTSSTASDRVLRPRNLSQAMGNNISLQDQPQLSPSSPTLTQPLSKDDVTKMVQSPIIMELVGEDNNPPEQDGKEAAQQKQLQQPKPEQQPLINLESFKKENETEKLNLLMEAINRLNVSVESKYDKIHEHLTGEEEGVFPRLRDCEAAIDDYRDRIEQLEETNELLKNDVVLLKGVIQVQERRWDTLNDAVTAIKARSMGNNIVISGLEGDQDNENCEQKVCNFMKKEMQMEMENTEVQVAHRLGPKTGRTRQMVVRCSNKLRSKIFTHTKNLKGKKNQQNQSFFVDPQLPEEYAAERRQINYKIAKIRQYNEGKDKNAQATYQIRQRQLYVNNELIRKKVQPPTSSHICNLSREEFDRLASLDISNSAGITEMGSSRISSINDISDLYMAVKIWHPESDHIMMGYKFGEDTGCCDDGEFHAGLKLQKLLEEREENNTVVFVAREYGGKHLGGKRFQLIMNQAREVLNKI